MLLKKLKAFILPQNSSILFQHISVFTDTPLKQLYEFSNEVGGGKSFYLSFQNILTVLSQNFQIELTVADSKKKNIKSTLRKGRISLSTAEVLISMLLCHTHNMHLVKLEKPNYFGNVFQYT